MKTWSRWRSALRNIVGKRQIERHLDDEVRSYVDLLIDQKIAGGMSELEARRAALAETGGAEQVKQAVRDHRAGTSLELLWQDVRYGFRQLRRNPAFTLTAMITLGLGTGATTSIFSAVYSLLLRPLPYHDSSRLMSISTAWPKYNSVHQPVIATDLVVAQSETKSFEQIGGYLPDLESNLTGRGDPVRLTNAMVTANFFSMLGVVPQLGRVFTTDETILGGPPVILLSDHLWRQKFSADAGIVGKSATVNGKQQTIIGVLPRHFSFPDASVEPDYYAPAVLKRETVVTEPFLVLYALGRLRPGVSIEQAQAEMRTFMEARGRTSYRPDMSVIAEGRTMVVEPLQRHLAGDNRRPLLILLVSVGAVLLIACTNVANLQLARAVSRQHETALRGALGASRLRLIRQSLVESFLLSLAAAALGLATAFLFTSLVRLAGAPSGDHPRWQALELLRLPFGKLSTVIQVDGWVMTFTIGLALLTTVLFGMAAALSGARRDPKNALQTTALRITEGREQRLLRHGLLIVEVGFGVVLLVSAGLLIRSFVNVLRSETGFDPSRMLTCVTILRDDKGDRVWGEERTRLFVDQILEKLNALPGAQAASITSLLPLEPGDPNSSVAYTDSMQDLPGSFKVVTTTSVTPDYFRVVGTTLIKGRAFNAGDRAGKPLASIVNRAFSQQFFGGDALGKRYYTSAGDHGRQRIPATIVGIVEDVKHGQVEEPAQPEAFVPMDQMPQNQLRLVVRTSGDPLLLVNALRQAVISADHNQPVFDIETMEQRVAAATAQRRLIMLLIACFALLAVTLSAVGVYGVFAYSVTRRRFEMGVRLALGSSRSGLLRLIVAQASQPILLGCIAGAGTALISTRLLASLLFGVTPRDPLSFSLAGALMAVAALLASIIPAAQAARTNLVAVLRSE